MLLSADLSASAALPCPFATSLKLQLDILKLYLLYLGGIITQNRCQSIKFILSFLQNFVSFKLPILKVFFPNGTLFWSQIILEQKLIFRNLSL